MKKRFVAALIISLAILTGCGRNAESDAALEASSAFAASDFESIFEALEPTEEASMEDSAESASSASSETSTAATEASTAATEASTAATEASSASSEASSSSEKASEKSSEAASGASSAETEQPAPAPKKDYGRIIFIGDSRTVDIFDSQGYEVYDKNVNGVRVFAENGKGYDYMMIMINRFDGSYETVVTWLGCNDHGNIEKYKKAYQDLLDKGINLVICNVGPTVDENLDEGDSVNYPNRNMVSFNEQIGAWAREHNVKVIDMYSYVNSHMTVDPDGIHFSPKEDMSTWNYIMNSL
jgi:hypothetical protein